MHRAFAPLDFMDNDCLSVKLPPYYDAKHNASLWFECVDARRNGTDARVDGVESH